MFSVHFTLLATRCEVHAHTYILQSSNKDNEDQTDLDKNEHSNLATTALALTETDTCPNDSVPHNILAHSFMWFVTSNIVEEPYVLVMADA